MAGTWGKVFRIVSAAALVALVAAGCGGSSRRHDSVVNLLPRPLMQAWATQASRIAATAAAGDGCRARQLAGSLRTEVISAGGKVPAQLRMPLLEDANSLADRIVCVLPPRTITATTPPKPKGPKEHGHHGHHGHAGGDQGNQS